jgi:hypothetical protein
MAGGLFNLVSTSGANLIIHGTPQKTFFKTAYSKITNFGLQKFRLDYDGIRDIRLTETSAFTFKVKRYADLLVDTYIGITLPDIWSPVYHPCSENNYKWTPYDFKWIKNIGAQIIKSVEINCGSFRIQKYSGEYISAMVERDFSAEKKDIFDKMTGNVAELNNPGNAFGRVNTYPNAFYTENTVGAEPSIRGRMIYVPINAWYTLDSKCAFPLISLLYNELTITVTLRPIQELIQVRDVFDPDNYFPYVQPDFNLERFQMYRFLQTPPGIRIPAGAYSYTTRTWNTDVHLMNTYCFLSAEERQKFAKEDQIYIIKDIIEYKFQNVTGTTRQKLSSTTGMVSSWMWFLQRNDVNMRNEWSNYTNWPYDNIPMNVQYASPDISSDINSDGYTLDDSMKLTAGMAYHPDGTNTGIFVSGDFNQDNVKNILLTMGIVFDGEYRENIFTREIFDYIEKYTRTQGSAKEGLYCYNFCLNTNPFVYQPSGAINLSNVRNLELEMSTFIPRFDPEGSYFGVICDGTDGNVIGVSNKPSWKLYQYNYNLTIFEERYNILSFLSGQCGLMYAR